MRGDDVDRMVKITYPTGRCQVCYTQVASYSDPESGIQICETWLAGESPGPGGDSRMSLIKITLMFL